MPRDGVAIVGHAVKQGGPAALLDPVQESLQHLPVPLGLRHDPQNFLLAVGALHHGVPKEHPAGNRQARPCGRPGAVEAEPRQVPVLAKVVRGHHEHPGRPVPLGHAPGGGQLVVGEPVQAEAVEELAGGAHVRAGWGRRLFLYPLSLFRLGHGWQGKTK